jgi:DNA-binding LacI/PurR family transcriptional regulator
MAKRTPAAARRATLAQIASELGVSVMTVSNAYNRPDQLSTGLRERILDAARERGYAGPDPVARGLRRGRTGALGVIYDTPPSFVFQDANAVAFLEGLSSVLERAFMGLLLVPGAWPDHGQARPLEIALVDGFVVYSVAATDPQVPIAVARRPTVIVDQPRVAGASFVGIDDVSAASAAARHLLGLGHRRIAVITFALARDGSEGFVTPPRQRAGTYEVTMARLSGYRAALSEAGINWSEIPVYECPGSSPHLGHRAANHVLAMRPAPSALLATSDALALGSLHAAQELGLQVPADLSIIGFDDSPQASAADPPLTTIRQPHTAKGRRAGHLLLERLDDTSAASTELLPADLVVRASTARPRRPPR